MQLLSDWPARLVLLATAFGLVVMHHVVSDRPHASTDAVPVETVVEQSVLGGTAAMTFAGDTDAHGGPPTAHHGSGSVGPAALPPDPAGGRGHDHGASLLHLCLAVLMGAAVVLVLVLAARWWRSARRPTVGTGIATVPRAPPTTARLAELQILRL
ncbi:DUF6153 family protein [Actinomycetospora cinnamomea]|uniref:Uncharacterized protein n=1 Tax=Actinomycetospora cinnamomea TaxID=663609 RepID=A0A2U1FRT9_9PSEU|nr:hypothetical protein C8D89_101648 [Actinomycetospora cinnamomea]